MSESEKTILILDDESFVRQSFVDYFEDNIWSVLEAESGEESIELLKSYSPSCAIVDVRLPGMNGNEFILKASEIKPDMVFVICTGSPEYNVSDELLKLSVVSNEIFRKPVVDISLLEKELLMLVDKRRMEEGN